MMNETTTTPHWKYATTRNSNAFTWVQRARQAERMQWEEHRKYVGCVLFMCGPEEEQQQHLATNVRHGQPKR